MFKNSLMASGPEDSADQGTHFLTAVLQGLTGPFSCCRRHLLLPSNPSQEPKTMLGSKPHTVQQRPPSGLPLCAQFPTKKQEEGCLPVWTWARLLKASEKITSRTQITLGSMVAMPFSSLLPGDSESGVRICLSPRF